MAPPPLAHALPPRLQRHGRALLGAAALALAGHALLLESWPDLRGAARRAQSGRTLQITTMATPPGPLHVPATGAVTAATAKAEHVQPTTAAPRRPPAALPVPAQPEATPTSITASTASTDATPHPAAEPETPFAPGGERLPVYATRLPPPATLLYALQRGDLKGQATLQWRSTPDSYSLSLQADAGKALLGRHSTGGFDTAGLAPERYAESRRGRELRAANFQRDAGLITFSGPAVHYPLLAGTQDRLSWMVQLGAVLAANPTLAEAGAQIALPVVGTRGDAQAWVFTVQAHEAESDASRPPTPAVRLLRLPERPYDTRVEVWLDPTRHHLPVRARLQVPASGDTLELVLRDLSLH